MARPLIFLHVFCIGGILATSITHGFTRRRPIRSLQIPPVSGICSTDFTDLHRFFLLQFPSLPSLSSISHFSLYYPFLPFYFFTFLPLKFPSLHPAFYRIVVGGFDGAVHGAVVWHEMVGAHDVVYAHEESVAVVRDAGTVACGCVTVG